MATTYSQLEALVTDRLNQDGWDIKKGDVTAVIQTMGDTVHELVGKGEAVTVRGLVKVEAKLKPKMPKRTVKMFGEEKMVAAKPASTKIRIIAVKALKDALPTPQKLQARARRTK